MRDQFVGALPHARYLLFHSRGISAWSEVVDGRPVASIGDSLISASFEKKLPFAGGEAVLVKYSREAQACPATFGWLLISGGQVSESPQFGTCSEAWLSASSEKGRLVVVMRDFLGMYEPRAEQKKAYRRKVTYVYDGKVVTENGRQLAVKR